MIKQYPEYVLAVLSEKAYDPKLFSKDGSKMIEIETKVGMSNKTFRFKIVDSTKSWDIKRLTGFNALSLNEIGTDKYVVAFRGTDMGLNPLELIPTALDVFSDIAEGVGLNPQVFIASRFTKKLLEKRDLNVQKDNVTLTGHSLGGILANHVSMALKIKATSFNSLGLMKMVNGKPYKNGMPMSEEDFAFAKANIKNVIYWDPEKENRDFLSSLLTITMKRIHLGKVKKVAGDVKGQLGAHKIGESVKATENEMRIWRNEKEYQTIPSDIFEAVTLNMRVASLDTNTFIDIKPYINKDNYALARISSEELSSYSKTINILETFVKGNPKAKLVSLENMPLSEMVAKAIACKEYAYALQEGNGFAVEKSIFMPGNLPTEVDEYTLRERARNIYVSFLKGKESIKAEKDIELIEKLELEKDIKLQGRDKVISILREIGIENIAKAILMDRKVKNLQDKLIFKDIQKTISKGNPQKISATLKKINKNESFIVNNKKNREIKRGTINTIIKLSAGQSTAKIVPLGYFSVDELTKLAGSDKAYLYALENENGFVVVNGNYDNYVPSLDSDDIFLKANEILNSLNGSI